MSAKSSAACRSALLIRRVEERLLDLFAQGKLFGTVHTCIGQELIAVAVADQLQDEDWVFSNHRCHGHFIARTDRVEGLIAEIMGKTTGVCGGWGGSQHLCADRFFSNGIQGGIVPCAAGLGLAERLAGSDNISVVFIGEGTLGEGVVYETANLISKWNVPLLIVLENNRYSQSTPQEIVLSGGLSERFKPFGIHTFHATTWDLDELLEETDKAVNHVRTQRCPALLHVETDRLKAHSKGDDDRATEEVQGYWSRDLLWKFSQEYAEDVATIEQKIEQRIAGAVDEALAADYPHPAKYGDVVEPTAPAWTATDIQTNARVGEAICATFHDWMQRDARIVMIGEDILSPYGGAFKVTKGLSDAFPDRILATSISEAAIIGIGNGLALSGMRPVCEIMFGDFITLATDQIVNHAAKFPQMYNAQVTVPLIVRTPMGGGRGYGPTHSQSLEKHYLGLPQTQVLALHHRFDPAEIYGALFETIDRMSLVVENKMLYAKRLSSQVADGWVLECSDEIFPTTRLRPAGKADLTVVCYGGTLHFVEEAIQTVFDKYEIICEVVCPISLYPLNIAPILESTLHTRRVLVVEEGHGFAGWGAEVLSRLGEHAPSHLVSAKRLTGPAHPIPSCGPLEKQLLPNADNIRDSIVGAVNDGTC